MKAGQILSPVHTWHSELLISFFYLVVLLLYKVTFVLLLQKTAQKKSQKRENPAKERNTQEVRTSQLNMTDYNFMYF